MKKTIVRLGPEALWVLCGQVGVALGGLLGIKVLTHLLNPYEFGKLTIANTIIILIGMIFFGPLGQGLMRYWSIACERKEISAFTAVSKKTILLLAFILGIITLISGLCVYLSKWHDWVWTISLAIVIGTFAGWSGIRLSILMAARKRKIVSLINSLTAFAKPGVGAALVILVGYRADFALIGYLIATGISIYMAELFYNKIVQVKERSSTIFQKTGVINRLQGEIISFSYPFLIWGGFAWAHQSCDRWAILSFDGADAVGAYSVISQLAFYPLVFGANFLSTFFVPIAYERAGRLQSEGAVRSGIWILSKMSCIYIAGAVVLIFIFSIFHRELVLLISNENYVAFSKLLPLLTGVWSLYYLGHILTGFGLLINRPHMYLAPVISSGIVASAMVFIGGSKFGIQGVIWALGFSSLFYASWCLLIAKTIISPKNY